MKLWKHRAMHVSYNMWVLHKASDKCLLFWSMEKGKGVWRVYPQGFFMSSGHKSLS